MLVSTAQLSRKQCKVLQRLFLQALRKFTYQIVHLQPEIEGLQQA
jgi:hypothetical protein